MFVLMTGLFISFPVHAQLATLTVNLQGLEPPTGTVEVTLFNSKEDYMKTPFLQQASPVENNTLSVEFAGIVDGDYAIVVVHDENGNDKLDNGFLGFGGEGIGYSNDAAPWWGRPSYEAARFTVGTEDLSVNITLE